MKKRIEWWVIISITVVIGVGFIAFSWWAIDDSIQSNVIEQPDNEQVEEFVPANIAFEPYLEVEGAIVDILSTPVAEDERLFLVDQSGQILISEDGEVSSEPFLDISDDVVFSGERGLLSLAFHPDYAQNRLAYVNLVEPSDNAAGRSVIYEFSVSEDEPNKLEPSSKREVISYDQPFGNHNGGKILFDSNDLLYIASGDGGNGGDPLENGQNLNTLLGKVLRIDPLPIANKSYSIPGDNPFVGTVDALPEIWAYGLRNPWRMSIDVETNQIYIADVGQGGFEEINRISLDEAGANFGWRCYEGPQKFSFNDCSDNVSDYTMPFIAYEHTGSQCTGSVTGGFVYRGSDQPSLQGQYIYADYCTGIVYLASSGDVAQDALALRDQENITTFGTDGRNELYVSQVRESGSTISKVVTE